MAEELKEMQAIANNPAPPTFENTIVAMEKSGQLLQRVATLSSVCPALTPILRCRKSGRSRRRNLRPIRDAIFLDPKLFQRVATIYKQRQYAQARSRVAAPGGV